MNIDMLFPTLTGDMTKLAPADPMSSDGNAQEFEDMLVQQSKSQQENSRPQKKAEDKEAPEKPEQKSTQEDEAAEKGGELAATLVTSQPVVPITVFEEAEVKVAEDGTVILEPVSMEGVAVEQPAEGIVEAVEVQPEEAAQQGQPVGGQFQEAAGTVVEAPKEEQPKAVEGQKVQPETVAEGRDKPEVTVQKAQPDSKPQDEEMDSNVEQESQPVFQDVKAAPVKVGDAHLVHFAQEPVEPENSQQLAGLLSRAMQEGADMVLVQLNPIELGSVTIELSRTAAGELTIVMNPDNARAANILNAHAENLIASLAEKGENVVSVHVNMPEDTENAGMMMDPDGHNGQNREDEDDGKKKKRESRTEGVSAADFLSQLRLGLIGNVE